MRVLLSIVLVCLPLIASSKEFVSFPPNFKWCVGISSHQHEGNNIHSDWWDFEKSRDDITDSGITVDHWNRWPRDILLVKDLEVQQFRMTLEWARIEPRQGQWDYSAILHYQTEILALRALGIEPLLTLHQLSLPKWFQDKGGFSWEGAPAAFARFAKLAVTVISPTTKWWTTSVDGSIHLLVGHGTDIIPPALNDFKSVPKAFYGFLRSHAAAYHAMHAARKESKYPIQVGIVHFIRLFEAPWWDPLNKWIAGRMNKLFNYLLSDTIHTGKVNFKIPFLIKLKADLPEVKGTQDFIGVNYYTRSIVNVNPLRGNLVKQIERIINGKRKGVPTSDIGWEIYPKGMYLSLKKLNKRYPKTPFYITEGGLADKSDRLRENYIKSHLYYLKQAMNEGVPVLGYCHWSLTDNFEWAEGYGPRFGLYEIDYDTLERIPRPSVDLVRQIAIENGFTY